MHKEMSEHTAVWWLSASQEKRPHNKTCLAGILVLDIQPPYLWEINVFRFYFSVVFSFSSPIWLRHVFKAYVWSPVGGRPGEASWFSDRILQSFHGTHCYLPAHFPLVSHWFSLCSSSTFCIHHRHCPACSLCTHDAHGLWIA